ncbi:MAG: fibrobacter succinogenes major paralogous domain-containing protein [Luteibaculaceae bacterium]
MKHNVIVEASSVQPWIKKIGTSLIHISALSILCIFFYACDNDEVEEPVEVNAPQASVLGGGATDIEGNTYATIVIGGLEWFAENLRTTKYRNGDDIPNVTTAAAWIQVNTGAYVAFNNLAANFTRFGALYNGYAVEDERGLCPEGWRIPTDNDWKNLEISIGMSNEFLEQTGVRGADISLNRRLRLSTWQEGNVDAIGFNAFSTSDAGAIQVGGQRLDDGEFRFLNQSASFWSSTRNPNQPLFTFFRFVVNTPTNDGVGRNNTVRGFGFYCRCVRNAS